GDHLGDPAALDRQLHRLGGELDLHLAVLDRTGQPIARFGRAPPPLSARDLDEVGHGATIVRHGGVILGAAAIRREPGGPIAGILVMTPRHELHPPSALAPIAWIALILV